MQNFRNMKNGTFILQIFKQCCWSRLEHSYQWLHVKDVLTVETNLQLKSSLTTEPIPPSHLHNGPLTPSCERMRAEWAGLRPITLQLAVINIQPASILMQKKLSHKKFFGCVPFILCGDLCDLNTWKVTLMYYSSQTFFILRFWLQTALKFIFTHKSDTFNHITQNTRQVSTVEWTKHIHHFLLKIRKLNYWNFAKIKHCPEKVVILRCFNWLCFLNLYLYVLTTAAVFDCARSWGCPALWLADSEGPSVIGWFRRTLCDWL